MKNIGEAIRHFRVNYKIKTSQTTLGRAIGKTTDSAAQSIIKHYENGTREVKDDDLKKILKYLEVSEDEFISYIEPEPLAPLIINGEEVPASFLELSPDAPKYFAMYAKADELGLEDMKISIANDMVKNLKERAEKFEKSADPK